MDETIIQKKRLYQWVMIKSGSEYLPGLLVAFFLILFGALVLTQLSPPTVVPMSSSSIEFSSMRAMKHIEAIAKNPRPLGSSAHDEVRDYILKALSEFDLKPIVQKRAEVSLTRDKSLNVANVENIAGRLKGSEGKKAVMLVAHYDSVHTSFGANDDGAGVAVLIETARALKAGNQLKNDIIFLFTDGEEIGLMGAKAFVDDHPWRNDVGVILNFEARGSSGPSLMFETSDHNGALIRGFSRVSPHPISNSILNEIYKRLGNSTDLNVFKDSGYAGMNFAYLKNLNHYHTRLDSLSTVDKRSLQHEGSYALPLSRYFGNTDLNNLKENNLIYFNLFGSSVIYYSYRWGYIFTILTTFTFAGIFIFGRRRNNITINRVLLGFAIYLGSILVTLLVVIGLLSLATRINRSFGLGIPGEGGNTAPYAISVVLLCLVIVSIIYEQLQKKISRENLVLGSLLLWLIMMIATTVVLPGASYIFTWPLLFSLIGMWFLIISANPQTMTINILITLIITAFPAFLLFGSMIYLIFIGLGLSIVLPIMVLLLLGLIIPHILTMMKPRRQVLPATAGLLSIAMMLWGVNWSRYNSHNPKQDTLVYCLNADTKVAYWASMSQMRDEWTSQVILKGADYGSLAEFFPLNDRVFLKSKAVMAPLPAIDIKLLKEDTSSGKRSLHFHITSLRQAPVATITIDPNAEVLGMVINDRQIYPVAGSSGIVLGGGHTINYFAFPKEGIDMTVVVKSLQPLMIRATDRSYGFPIIMGSPIKPRPDNFMAAAARYTDLTLVTRTFSF